jgi:uncharacterized membrane protein
MRNILLVLHIVGVAGWLGGGFYGMYAYSVVARMGPPAAGDGLKGLEKRASVYFGVFAGLVLISGIALVLTSDAFGWGDAFVIIGLVAFVVSSVVQSTVGRRSNERLTAAVGSGSGVDQALAGWRLAGASDIIILVIVIWAMVAKLGT